jgi:ArsR family transcriptional regulator
MDTRLQQLEQLFRALADATRLRILGLLAGGEVCVCHICETLAIPQPKASRHLAYLRRTGLVDTRRQGLWIHYRLAEPEDPTVRTVLSAAVHTLGHVTTAKSDQRRLGRFVRRRESARTLLPVVACCAGSSEAMSGG